ncbi:HTH-type transcriptional activator IlvY [Marispirochaeta aestuarii]|uniref:HTH-type transcriptional activator IlvY n=1 Tax=Marispirochaeta aestuarii TaxID=1963862 RepID=UPI0029C8395B|nr:HTH-type transcriptional activator IlvY [Marispirochaeta aestuarii]
MDIYEMRFFLAAADTLHFGRASQVCNISPSALSRGIQRIEEEIGEALFVRDRKGVRLTDAGRRFREYARGSIEGLEELKRSIHSAELTGEIRLYCSVTACYSVLPSILSRFREAYPGISIKLHTGAASDAVEIVSSGDVDLAVIARPDTPMPGLLFQELTTTPLVFVAPRQEWQYTETLEQEFIPWSEIPMILPERGLMRKRVLRWFRERGESPKVYAEVAGNEAILALVSLNCGVGVVPRLVVEKSPVARKIRILKVRPPLEPYSVGMCVRKGAIQSPTLSAFWGLGGTED